MSAQQQDGDDNVVALSPGKRLQKARESAQLSQMEVADRLRLPMATVKALEQDDWGKLHSTYARGYLRNYARLLGLNPDLFVEPLPSQVAEAPVVNSYRIGPAQYVTSGDGPVKLVTYLVSMILAVLAFSWWQSRQIEPVATAPAPEAVAPAPSASVTDTAPAPMAAPIVTESPLSADATAAVPASAVVPSATEPVTAATSADLAATTPAQTTSVPTTESPNMPSADAAGTPTVTTAIAMNEENARGLMFQLNSDSWAEVTDATGKRLFYDLAKRGQTVKLAGEAPYKVIVGNAPSVTMYYDGKPVDISSIARAGVARFKIGDEGVLH
jgi:cytoskeleton protein RodZ